MLKNIVIKGAKEHNLKNISLEVPKEKLVVITGLSGSGKSSLAFDTIYAEGQRRYVESLSAYARQFLDKMKKPNVDMIEGLSPAISIEQKNTSKNPGTLVKLNGSTNNRDGIGAKITINTGAEKQTRTINIARGYLSADEPVAHFGITEDEKISKLIFRSKK